MTTGDQDEEAALSDVASMLWRLRELQDKLLFKLAVQQLVLDSGPGRWLASSTRELDAALHDVQSAEMVRAAKVDALAGRLKLPAGSTLRQLADAAPEPWGTILHEHRDALQLLTAELAAAAADAAPAPLAEPGEDDLEAELVRKVAAQTVARVQLSSLTDFLR